MKKRVVTYLTTLVITLIASSSAIAAKHRDNFIPYVGADAEWRHLDFKKEFGGNLFRHDYPQGNIYAGIKFNEYVGIEAGYEATARKTRSVMLQPGSVVTGNMIFIAVDSQDSILYHSTGQIKGPHADLVGFLPICERYRLQLIGSVGAAHLKASLVRNRISLNTSIGNFPVPQSKNFIERKTVLRLGAGIQQMINKCCGIRAMVKWENTNRIKIGAVENTNSSVDNFAKLKSSFIYSLGAFFTF